MKEILTVLLAVFLLTGCSGGKSSSWDSDQITVDGQVISMDMTLKKILEVSKSAYSMSRYYKLPKDVKFNEVELEYGEFLNINVMTKKSLEEDAYGAIEMMIVNTKESTQSLPDSTPLVITINLANAAEDFKSTEIEFPGGIKAGSTREDVIKAYGDKFESTGKSKITYTKELTSKGGKADHYLELEFNSKDELKSYTLVNSKGVPASDVEEYTFK